MLHQGPTNRAPADQAKAWRSRLPKLSYWIFAPISFLDEFLKIVRLMISLKIPFQDVPKDCGFPEGTPNGVSALATASRAGGGTQNHICIAMFSLAPPTLHPVETHESVKKALIKIDHSPKRGGHTLSWRRCSTNPSLEYLLYYPSNI